MSFTAEIKQELAYPELKKCCAIAQLSALLWLTSSPTITNKKLNLVIRSENPTTAKRIVALIKKLYKVDTNLSFVRKGNLRKNNIYTIRITENVTRILKDLGIYKDDKGFLSHPTYNIVSKNCCGRSFIAGAFLAYGSCNSPQSSNYHLEISLRDEEHAKFLAKIINRYSFDTRISKRRKKYIVYIKKADTIADFLKLIEANSSCLKFENIRIDRDFIQSQKRIENCLIFDEMKAIKTANTQIESLKKIKKAKKIDNLNDKLKKVYYLRMNNQESSLKELTKKYYEDYGEEISKSGLKHRLDKLIELSNDLK